MIKKQLPQNPNSFFMLIKNKLGFVRFSILLIVIPLLIVGMILGLQQNKDFAVYMQVNIGQISQYDPYITDKIYYSPTQYAGIKINLSAFSNAKYWECVLGGEYTAEFYNGENIVGSVHIANKTNHVIEVPQSAIDAQYDSILLMPISGKILFVSYFAPISTPENTQVLQTMPDRQFKSYMLGGEYSETGTPYMIDGLFSHIISFSADKLILDVSSINDELTCILVSVIDDDGNLIAEFDTNTVLPAYTEEAESLIFELNVINPNYIASDLRLKYHYEGSTETKFWEINPYMQINEEAYNGTLIRTRDNMAEFDNVIVDGDIVRFSGEEVKIEKALFIPKGYTLEVAAGQQIDLLNEAFILCRSPVYFNGTKENPISVTTTDNSLHSGLVVMQANEKSVLNYVNFDNLGEVSSGTWKLTGAVTFYESNVQINNCNFTNNRSEDGLNSIRCHIEVNDTTFRNAFQDAYDSDFCTGEFNNVTFENSGNDGFDVSTSTFTLNDCTFINTFDKAISTGERSTITVNGVLIDGAQTGLAAKDSSVLTVDDAIVKNVFIGICVYQKKPEFGASQVTATNYSLKGTYDFPYIIEKQDTVFVNGKQLIASSKKKEALVIERMINEVPIK